MSFGFFKPVSVGVIVHARVEGCFDSCGLQLASVTTCVCSVLGILRCVFFGALLGILTGMGAILVWLAFGVGNHQRTGYSVLGI